MKLTALVLALAGTLSLNSSFAQSYDMSGSHFESEFQFELKNIKSMSDVWRGVSERYVGASLIDASLIVEGAPFYVLRIWDGQKLVSLDVNAESGKISPVVEDEEPTLAAAPVNLSQAIDVAERHIQGTALVAELDMDNAYRVELIKDKKYYTLMVSAETANVLTVESELLEYGESFMPAKSLTSLATALNKVAANIQGKLVSVAYHFEEKADTQAVLELEVQDQKGYDSLLVAVNSGQVLLSEREHQAKVLAKLGQTKVQNPQQVLQNAKSLLNARVVSVTLFEDKGTLVYGVELSSATLSKWAEFDAVTGKFLRVEDEPQV